MTTFHLHINTDNGAFFDDDTITDENPDGDFRPAPELARLLREIADRIETGGAELGWYQTIHDVNGNDVGRYALKNADSTPARV